MIWNTFDYVEILTDKLKQNEHIRGYQGLLAKAAGAHASYFSRVLQEEVLLTLDQAASLSEFWKLNYEEAQFFLCLVSYKRAANSSLKEILKRRIEELRARQEDLATRFSRNSPPLSGNLTVYYSAWYFSAIHIALTVPNLRSVAALAKRFALEPKLVEMVLATLEGLGLAKKNSKNEWVTLVFDLHLNHAEYFSSTHHAHWRMLAANKVFQPSENALHYSGVHSLSRKDFVKIRRQLVDEITHVRNKVASSAEEEVVSFALDWYVL